LLLVGSQALMFGGYPFTCTGLGAGRIEVTRVCHAGKCAGWQKSRYANFPEIVACSMCAQTRPGYPNGCSIG
jgi:hypothetical protein